MAITLNGTTGITTPALDSEGNLEYSGTLTGGTGVLNIGSGQVVKDANGNVGIGTSAPITKLEVARGSEGEYLRVGGDDVANGRALRFTSSTIGGGTGALHTITASSFIGALAFATGTTERARIDASGNLLVGTTSDAPRNLTSGSGIRLGSAGQLELAGASGTNYINVTAASGTLLEFRRQGPNAVGSISTNGTTAAYNTSSDYRLKENVQPMTGALEKVAALNPVTYNWKLDGSAGQGFIAHELQAVVPDCVTGEKDEVDEEGNPQYQGVDTSFLVGILTAAIQEQQTLIQALTARIEALEVA